MKNIFKRAEQGNLIANMIEYDTFKDELFAIAESKGELEFIGQFIEELLYQYEEKLEEMENGK